jgi:hypothetical protein
MGTDTFRAGRGVYNGALTRFVPSRNVSVRDLMRTSCEISRRSRSFTLGNALIARRSRAFQTSGPRIEDAEPANDRSRAPCQCDAYCPMQLTSGF